MLRALAKLELLSYGSTSSLRESKSPSTDVSQGGNQPPGEANPPHVWLRERYVESGTWPEKLHILKLAQTLYTELTQQKPVEVVAETATQRIHRILRDGEGWAARDVANVFLCSATEVRRIRVEHECNPETGTHLKELDAIAMYKDDIPKREIARLLKKPYPTIQYWLKNVS